MNWFLWAAGVALLIGLANCGWALYMLGVSDGRKSRFIGRLPPLPYVVDEEEK